MTTQAAHQTRSTRAPASRIVESRGVIAGCAVARSTPVRRTPFLIVLHDRARTTERRSAGVAHAGCGVNEVTPGTACPSDAPRRVVDGTCGARVLGSDVGSLPAVKEGRSGCASAPWLGGGHHRRDRSPGVYTAPRRTGDKLEANKHSHLLALGLLGEVAVEQEEEAVHLGAHDL